MPYTYEYPRPAVTTDAVLMSVKDGRLEVLVVLRKNDPFGGCWAMPGGFVDMEESPEDAVVRELEEETGVTGVRFDQLHTFGDPHRDPRGRSISIAYLALVDGSRFSPKAADDAADVQWLAVDTAHDLAFDHAKMVVCGRDRLRILARYAGVGAQCLPDAFSLDRLREVYEAVEGTKHAPAQFEQRVKAMGIVEPADGAGQLYRFVRERVASV